MSQYLLIESRDAFECNDVGYFLTLASELAARGNQVTVFLVQNAVLATRASGSTATQLASLASSGVTILADDFSLAERGIVDSKLAPGIRPSSIDVVVDQLEAGAKTLWH